jgi:hypothetical protein
VLEHDPAEPRPERRRLAQRGQRAVRLDERLLRSVFSQVVVAQNRRRVPDGKILVRADEFRECVRVAGLAKTHQLAGPLPVEHALLKRPRLYGTGVTGHHDSRVIADDDVTSVQIDIARSVAESVSISGSVAP